MTSIEIAVDEPPLKLVLLEGDAGRPTVMDHLGVEVETGEEVDAATARLAEAGLVTRAEDDTVCCYARQDKVWVDGPGTESWEVYVVTEDSATFFAADDERAAATSAAACC